MNIFNYIILCDPTTYHNPFLEEFRLIIIQLKYNIMDYNGKSVKTFCSSWSQHRTPALNTRSDVHTKKPILQFIMFGLWKKIAFQVSYKGGFKITGHKKHNFEISNFFFSNWVILYKKWRKQKLLRDLPNYYGAVCFSKITAKILPRRWLVLAFLGNQELRWNYRVNRWEIYIKRRFLNSPTNYYERKTQNTKLQKEA